MVNFVVKPGLYDSLPQFLLARVRGLRDSPEFALVSQYGHLPSVVCGVLGQLLARLQAQEVAGTLDAEGQQQLASAYSMVEEMARSTDPEVQNAVYVEVLEVLADASPLWRFIKANLGPSTVGLLERWPIDGS